jgi:hypothetical protein
LKKILLTAKVVQESKTHFLVMFEDTSGWKWVNKKAVSQQSKTRRQSYIDRNKKS